MSEANVTIKPQPESPERSERLRRGSLSDHFLGGEDRRRHASSRHTRIVNVMKLFLAALAAGLVLTVIAWSNSDDEEGGISLSSRTIIGLATKQTMKDPRFVGTDKAGRPYVVTADSAVQDKDNQRLISLANLKTDVSLEEDHQVKASARQGLFNQQEMTLELFGPVAIFSSYGYELHTAGAFLNLNEGTARSTEPVEGMGPMGTITANRMWVSEKGASIFFEGNVHMHIKNDKTADK